MKAKAAVLVADRTLDLREIDVPTSPPPGGALVRVEGCGMCGSDIEQYEGVVARSGVHGFPVIPGHEPIGRIAAIDPAAARSRNLKEGDRVAIHSVAPCGVCSGCMAGGRCHDSFYYGFRSLDIGSGLWGGFSQWMEITPRTKLYPIASALAIEDALLFNPFAAGFDWVIRQGKLEAGQTILVLGAGQRGLASVIAAREAGASRIIVTGLRKDFYKLEVARDFGATETLFADEDPIVERVLEATSRRGVDVVVDTTPLAFQPILDAVGAVRNGGTIVLGGLKGYRPMPAFPVDTFLHKQLHMVGALAAGQWSVEQAIRVIGEGRFPVAKMHTHSFGLERLEHAIHLLAGEIPDQTALHISILPD